MSTPGSVESPIAEYTVDGKVEICRIVVFCDDDAWLVKETPKGWVKVRDATPRDMRYFGREDLKWSQRALDAAGRTDGRE